MIMYCRLKLNGVSVYELPNNFFGNLVETSRSKNTLDLTICAW